MPVHVLALPKFMPSVPVVVIVPPLSVESVATLVTVPVPLTVVHVAAVPLLAVRTCPDVGAVAAETSMVVVADFKALVMPDVNPVAVPVQFVRTPDVGVPSRGVTRVGEVANTALPVPVSSVSAVSKFDELNEPNEVAFPDEVIAPVKLALVVTVAALPVILPAILFVTVKSTNQAFTIRVPVLPIMPLASVANIDAAAPGAEDDVMACV